MEVILIRHTSVDVPPHTCYGQTDVPVAATFEQEAEETKRNLAQYLPFDAVFSSPLTRATKLAAYCGYPDAETDPRLMEMNMGDWEMQQYDDISDPYIQEWYNDCLRLPTPHGESFTMQRERVDRFLDELREKPYRRVAVFAHGGVLACAAIYAGLYSLETAWDHPTPYGGMIRIEVRGER